MFAVAYQDGQAAYFVIEGHGLRSEDHKAPAAARERQARGELPPGRIVSVKRVR